MEHFLHAPRSVGGFPPKFDGGKTYISSTVLLHKFAPASWRIFLLMKTEENVGVEKLPEEKDGGKNKRKGTFSFFLH
jgi:hypothetical protein